MLDTVFFKVVIGLESRVCLLQVGESGYAAGVVGSHCGTTQALAQNTVAGAEGGGVVGGVEDGALGLCRMLEMRKFEVGVVEGMGGSRKMGGDEQNIPP